MQKNIQYRLLNKEEIKPGDEILRVHNEWVSADTLVGQTVQDHFYPVRRRCYEAELLNAFKQIRDEHWEGLPGKVGDIILATIALAEGRAE